VLGATAVTLAVGALPGRAGAQQEAFFRVSDLSATVTNDGDLEGTQEVVLSVSGFGSQSLTLALSASRSTRGTSSFAPTGKSVSAM
jgi:thioredoxin reductase